MKNALQMYIKYIGLFSCRMPTNVCMKSSLKVRLIKIRMTKSIKLMVGRLRIKICKYIKDTTYKWQCYCS
jgi:hypothetical protein